MMLTREQVDELERRRKEWRSGPPPLSPEEREALADYYQHEIVELSEMLAAHGMPTIADAVETAWDEGLLDTSAALLEFKAFLESKNGPPA